MKRQSIVGSAKHKKAQAAVNARYSVLLAETLKERGDRYGDFTDNAVVAQELKDALRRSPGWDRLRAVHKESLDVMCSKMSRIVTGDPEYKDNWHDIGGYAKIIEDRCE